MTTTRVFNIAAQPGIFRDWTLNSSPGWTFGEYTRFFEGRPKKIGGWTQIASIGLSPNNTPFSATGLEPNDANPSLLTIGNIRKILTYPVDGRYIVVIAADVLGVLEDISSTININEVLYPSGVFIGISDDSFILPIKFFPIRFQRYFVQDGDDTVDSAFVPGQYNWSLSIYGVSSGGQYNIPNIIPTVADSALASLALVAHAAPSLQNKDSTQDNYVFFALLSDMFDVTNEDNFVLDPCLTSFPTVISTKSQNVRYVFSPIMYPITQVPIGGVNAYDPNNPYAYPTPVTTEAIWATSEVYVSGGVQAVRPFLIAYSNNGLVRNCSSNAPSVWFNNGNVYYNQNPLLANDNNIDNYKVIRVATMRTGAQLSFMIWTTNTLSTATFCGAPGIFSYSTISFSSSIMSANSVIEHNGIFYWVGEDKFYQSNGATLDALPNQVNLNWFFDNLNHNQRGKVWTFKNPKFSEIWFVFPTLDSEEPNHAVIYNFLLQTWYDTPWNRTAGYFDPSYYRPILAGGFVPLDNKFLINLPEGVTSPMPWQVLLGENPIGPALWLHEIGLDEVTPIQSIPIEAFIESSNIGYTNGGVNIPAGQSTEGINSKTYIDRIEPDILGEGTNYISITARDYPLSIPIQLFYSSYNLPASYFAPNVQGRLLTVRFGCNALGSTFLLGKAIITSKPGDNRA